MADDPVAALIAETFDSYNEAFRGGEVERARLQRLWHPDGRHLTPFAALEGRTYDYEVDALHADPRQAFEAVGLDPGSA